LADLKAAQEANAAADTATKEDLIAQLAEQNTLITALVNQLANAPANPDADNVDTTAGGAE